MSGPGPAGPGGGGIEPAAGVEPARSAPAPVVADRVPPPRSGPSGGDLAAGEERPMPTTERPIVLATGGTVGHVAPALAVAEALLDLGVDPTELVLVGPARGLAGRGAAYGIPEELIDVRGVPRRSPLGALAAVVGLGRESVGLRRRYARRPPGVVVAFGGYGGVAPALAARSLGIPLVVVNPDRRPGAANRLLAPLAAWSALGSAATRLPRGVVVGVPVRRAVRRGRELPPAAARAQLGLPLERTTVLVFGGSQGAGRLNRAVGELVARWRERVDLSVAHVVGERDWKGPALVVDPGQLAYRAWPFLEDMGVALAAADVVVGRAGIGTVAEVAAVGRAAVLVPLPARHVRQDDNARLLAGVGAALVLEDERCDGAALDRLLGPLLADEARRRRMAEAAAALGRTDAAATIGRLVLELRTTGARGSGPGVSPAGRRPAGAHGRRGAGEVTSGRPNATLGATGGGSGRPSEDGGSRASTSAPATRPEDAAEGGGDGL